MSFASLLSTSIRNVILPMQLKPFDGSTAEGRSRERIRRIALSAGASAMARGVEVVTTLISVPLTLNYLGAERYGMWLVISSVIAVLGFADFGIGNGIINLISEANGKEDKEGARAYVSHAFFMLSVVGIVLGGIFILAYPFIPWHSVFNVKSAEAIAESGPAMAVFMVCFLLNIPLGIVQKVQIGYQEGFVNSLWQSGGSVLGLVSVLMVIYSKAGLPWLVLAMSGAPLLVTLLNGVILFGFRRPWLRPKWGSFNAAISRRILKFGSLFLSLQVAMALGFQSDNLVIGYFLGAHQVPQYAVPMKLFMLIPMVLSFMLMPLWPAYGEAMVRGDLGWIRRTFCQLTLVSFALSLPPSMLLVVFGAKIVHFWVGPEITPPLPLLLGFGAWAVIYSLCVSVAMLLNGIGILRFQVISGLAMGVSNLFLSIILLRWLGVMGPILGTLIALLLFSLLPYTVYIRRMFTSWQCRAPA